jgi:hypothetical protein
MATTTRTQPSQDIPLDRLDSFSASFHQNDFESAATTMPTTGPSLPPIDGGRQAWAYLLSAMVLETLVWGKHRYRSQPGLLIRLTGLAMHQQAFLSPTEVSHRRIDRILSKQSVAIVFAVFLSHYLAIWPDATSTLPQVGTVSTVSTTT